MLAKIFVVSCLAFAVLSENVLPEDDCNHITSKCCQNFNRIRMNAINGQIKTELEASYVYMALGAHFSRDDPDKQGFAKFFYSSSAEEREHALKLIDYQNKRGGIVKLHSIKSPETYTDDLTGLQAMTKALKLEKDVNDALLKLHEQVENDPQMQDFLETHYLEEQVESIRELAGYVSKLTRLNSTNPELGEHIFDQELLKKLDKN